MVNAQQTGAGKPQEKFKGPVKVFILAGQSNMEGHAGVESLDPPANMPGGDSRTATQALNNVTHPWTLLIADKRVAGDCKVGKDLLGGMNTLAGIHTCLPVAKPHGLAYLKAAQRLD
jgi:hypothetical protein